MTLPVHEKTTWSSRASSTSKNVSGSIHWQLKSLSHQRLSKSAAPGLWCRLTSSGAVQVLKDDDDQLMKVLLSSV